MVPPELSFTGYRRKGRYLLRVGKCEVWLTAGLYEEMFNLAFAKLTTKTAAVRLTPLITWRLRNAIAEATGLARGIIESVGGGDYILTTDVTFNCFDATFFELQQANPVPPRFVASLQSLMHEGSEPIG